MNGVVNKIYILVSPDHLCAARPSPSREAVVNLGKTAEEEGFKQCCLGNFISQQQLEEGPKASGWTVN